MSNPLLTKEPVDRGNEHVPSDVELAIRRLVAKGHENLSWSKLARFYGMTEITLQHVAYGRNFSIETAVKILAKHGKKLMIVEDTDNGNRTEN